MTKPALPEHSDGIHLTLDELLLYKAQAIHWLPPARSVWSLSQGIHQSSKLGRGMDFSEVRQYQPGDDIRSIDWRVTARTGKPHTKLFSEEKETPVILYLDLTQSMFFGSSLLLKSVQLAHMASLICWLSVAKGDRIGAVIDNGGRLIDLKPAGRQRGALHVLQALINEHNRVIASDARPQAGSMAPAIQALHRLCPKGSEIILLSDFVRLEADLHPAIRQLRQHNYLRFVQLSDPLEHGETRFRGIEQVSDLQRTIWLDFSSKITRQRLADSFQSKQEQIQSLARSVASSYMSLSSNQPLLKQLIG